MTLHRSRDYAEPPSGPFSSPCISGRTLIACQNCASAKTGCDKKIPCSRCIEKNLQCTARYARRASKAAIRAAQAATLSTKDQMNSFSFRPQQFQNNAVSSTIENYSESMIQSSIHHLHGCTDQYEDNIWDILNPLSPLSGYSAAAPSLGSNSSYSDNLNAFEHKQSSPTPIGFSEFSTNIDFIGNDVSMRIPKSFRRHPRDPDNCCDKPNSFSETPSSQDLKNCANFVDISDIGHDAPSFLGGFHDPLLDVVNVPDHPYLADRPNLSCAKTWMRRLRRKGLFDSHNPGIAVGKSVRLHQRSKMDSQYPNCDRLAYNWIKLDQELSLFYDVEQTLSASDLEQPLPDPNLPWYTRTITQTSNLYLIHGLHPDTNTEEVLDFELRPTLNQLFEDFLHGTLPGRVPPRHIQLLLHPLQALIHHSRGLLSWARSSSSMALSEAANSSLLELRRLLQAWYNLAMEHCNENIFVNDITLGLILYHFICLNLAANFVDIERLADRESLSLSFWQQSLQDERCIRSRQETIFHCGQALRYLRAVNLDTRPWWWPTAVHRAVLTLWAAATLGPVPSTESPKASLFPLEDPWQQSSMDIEPETNISTPKLSIIAIDNITPEDAAFSDANWSEKHMLVLTRQDKEAVALADATGILQYGILLINAFPSSFEGEAVITKLKDIGQAWEANGGSHVYYQS